MSENFSYEDMEMRWGSAVAHYLLCEIEKAAKIASNEKVSSEARLETAFRARDTLRGTATVTA
jgi:hypothetical protein